MYGSTGPRRTRRSQEPDVAVVGLGYVGLTLAALFASGGLRTLGLEVNPATVKAVRARLAPFFEPGLTETLASLPDGQLTVRTAMPDTLPRAVVICVGTPIDPVTREPVLAAFDAVIKGIAERIGAGTLVVIRSTVPLGTARSRVLPRLADRVVSPLLAVCPERSIQGRALAELRELPQVIGGLNDESRCRAEELFAHVASRRVPVSSLEAAEMVKLVNNAHTDIIYGFGNEVADMAGAVGLDANEIISAANVGYPRPDLSRPGFVGGSCLTKDPYILMHSLAPAGVRPRLIAAARAVNEALPGRVVDLVSAALRRAGQPLHDAKVLVCGMAYKGRPETDDVRGAASADVARMLSERVRMLAGHDFLVPPRQIAALGYVPTSLEAGLAGANALILLTEHPGYADLDVATIARLMSAPAIVFDVWGLVRDELDGSDKVTYLRWGRG